MPDQQSAYWADWTIALALRTGTLQGVLSTPKHPHIGTVHGSDYSRLATAHTQAALREELVPLLLLGEVVACHGCSPSSMPGSILVRRFRDASGGGEIFNRLTLTRFSPIRQTGGF